jgi:predicted transcriptional regulator
MGQETWREGETGQIIKKYRHLKGLSQHDLSRLCNLNQSTITDYEDG